MATTTTMRTRMADRIHPARGVVVIWREADGTFAVTHEDLYGVYSEATGFRTFRRAATEGAALAGREKW